MSVGCGVSTIDVRHDGLGRFRRICGAERADAQKQLWDRQWKRRQALERKYAGGELLIALKKAQADEMSEEAAREIGSLTSILFQALGSSATIDWSQLTEQKEFPEPPPTAPVPPQIEREPRQKDFRPAPPRSLIELLNASGRRQQRDAAIKAFDSAHEGWEYTVRWKAQQHDKAIKAHRAAHSEWDARKSAFHSTQAKANARLESLRRNYAEKDKEAVAGYCDLVLLSVPRPEGFPKFWQIGFSAATGVSVDYDLPSSDQIPSVKAVKYLASRDAFETVVLSEAEREQLYGEAVHQTCLAVLHRLFAADGADALRSITFNGWANVIDTANGRPSRACIMSVQTTKPVFQQIDLSSVDPRACFKALNGTTSAKLAAMSAPPPLAG